MRAKNTGSSQRGFTVIEMLLVLTAFCLFVSLVLIGVARQQAIRRDVTRTANVSQLRKALALYVSEYQTYPVTKGCITGNDELATELIGRKLIEPGAKLSDPRYPEEVLNCLYYDSDGSTYTLRYVLETDSIEPKGSHAAVP